MFAADRNQDNVFDLGTHRQKHSDDPVPISQKIAERGLERREAMDDGGRTVAAMYGDGLGTVPLDMGISEADLIEVRDGIDAAWEAWKLEKAPLTEGEARQKVAGYVDEARAKLLAASQLCAKHDDLEAIHARVASVSLEVDTLASDLTDRGSAA